MGKKTFKVKIPSGYEIDKENSTSEEIKFKKIENEYPKSWEDAFVGKPINGYFIHIDSCIKATKWNDCTDIDKNVFKTEEQALSAVAYAQLTQLMALPCYNGDWVADWDDGTSTKWAVDRLKNTLYITSYQKSYVPIAFKSRKIRDKFLENHEDLLKQYFQID